VIASRLGYVGKVKKPPEKKEKVVQKDVKKVKRIIKVKVVCSRNDIKKGSTISSNDLIVKEFVKEDLNGLDTFKNISSLKDMVAVVNIKSGQKIQKKYALDISKIKKLSYRIKPGLRAISLKIADISAAISGLINQGEKVDVLAVFDNTRDVDNPFSKIVVQNASLLAVDKEYLLDEDSKSAGSSKKGASKTSKNKIEGKKISVATLLVTPKDAEKLALISERAKFYLIMRSPFDDDKVKALGVSEREILGFSRRDDLLKDRKAEATLKELKIKKDSIAIYRGINMTNSDTPVNNNVPQND